MAPRSTSIARQQQATRTTEIAYARDIAHVLTEPAARIVRMRVLPVLEFFARQQATEEALALDAIEDDLKERLGEVLEDASAEHLVVTTVEAERIAREALGKAEQRNRRVVDGQLKDAAEKSTRRRMSAVEARRRLGVNPLGAEPWLAAVGREALTESLSRMRDATRAIYTRLGRQVADQLSRGIRIEEIAKRIERDYATGHKDGALAMTRRRARLIARNELGNYTAAITKRRHEDLGVEWYIWRTSRDERVRGRGGRYPKAKPSHRKREGKRFRYDSPPRESPSDGHPGEDYQCRCTAQPDLQIDPEALRRSK